MIRILLLKIILILLAVFQYSLDATSLTVLPKTQKLSYDSLGIFMRFRTSIFRGCTEFFTL